MKPLHILAATFLLSVALRAPMAIAQQAGSAAPSPKPALNPLKLQEQAVPGTYDNVLKAAIRVGAFDLNDDRIIDDLAKVLHCDIYKKYVQNEFDWRRVRIAMRKSFQLEMPNYPTVISLEREEKFGKYDFSSGILNLTPKYVMNSTNQLQLYHQKDGYGCGGDIKALPSIFIAVLDKAIQINGIQLDPADAQKVVSRLKTEDFNPETQEITRLAYGRFTVSLRSLNKISRGNSISINASLVNMTFYEDEYFRKPFWSGLSTVTGNTAIKNTLQAIPFGGITDR